ncbi:MAG: ABC transporter ATP-binding protein [Egibacteraceae bacterium]
MRATATHWRLLAELLVPHRSAVIMLGVALAAAGALPLVGPQLLRAFVDAAAAEATGGRLLGIAGLYAALGLAAQGALVATTWGATRVAWRATNALRERACEHALSLDLSYHAATSPGALIERIDGDATAIAQFFTDFVVRVAGAVLTLVGALLLVGVEDWRVGAAATFFVLAALALTVRLRDRAVPEGMAERAAFARVMGLVEEYLDGAQDLRALGAGEHALSQHERVSGHHVEAAVRAERTAIWIWIAVMGFFALGTVLMLSAGTLLLRREAITLGTVVLLFGYVQVLRRPIELIAEQLQQVQRAAAGAGRMRRLLDEPVGIVPDGRDELPSGALEVALDHVGFSYDDRDDDTGTDAVAGRPVLTDIDLVLPAGQVTGLVGPSGSGKSTLARLMLRLADPTSGAVHVGGVDLRLAEHDSLRHRVAVVTQDVQVFRATVRENVTLFGAVEADDDDLRALLAELGLNAWLARLPQGLDSVFGTDVAASAGQAQLLGLARAFLRDPGLVVLDEASSRVDPVTAALVEAALNRLLKGRTAVVIAHRLQAVERADTVVVLENGRVIEHGPRTALADDAASRFAALLRAELAATGRPEAAPAEPTYARV